jgi:hypothetical protein
MVGIRGRQPRSNLIQLLAPAGEISLNLPELLSQFLLQTKARRVGGSGTRPAAHHPASDPSGPAAHGKPDDQCEDWVHCSSSVQNSASNVHPPAK